MEKETTINEEHGKTIFRLWLQTQFTSRRKKNSRYSLRAFAKVLAIDPSTLSQILSGKRNLSTKAMRSICEKLSATPKDLQRFALVNTPLEGDENFIQVSTDTFMVISEWYHYAILELTYVSVFKSNPKWKAYWLST